MTLEPRRVAAVLSVTLVGLLAVAVATASPQPSRPAADRSAAAVATPQPSLAKPSAAATAKPTPKPTPKPVAAKWGEPQLVFPGGCGATQAGFDASGRAHIAASCDQKLIYSVGTTQGTWATTQFDVPANRVEQDPQLAFESNVAWLAYSRLAIGDGGCGDDGLNDVGVFYRKRTLPSGDWSDPKRIGQASDHLMAFRVHGTTLHLIVTTQGDGAVYYELVNGSGTHRYRIPGASSTSLRVGHDGRARIAYQANGTLRVATFTGSGLSSVKVPATAVLDAGLALDARDHVHLIYSRHADWSTGGCADGGDDDPNAGVYYVTNASGAWRTERLTKELGSVSFQVDAKTGEVRAALGLDSGMAYYTRAPGGAWRHEKLTANGYGPVLTRDPASGRLLVVYSGGTGATSEGIYAISKGG
ncbi:MAG TPA: hypothetical protein VKA85_02295 [Candidatus Limnocylindrales bacterium]|nr:hypothetical protein [Candidatus Limnocylindrales bacterium]